MLIVRSLKASDLPEVASIHVNCWKIAYKNLLPQNYLDSLQIPSRQVKWENGLIVNPDVIRLVAVEKSVTVGFIAGLENRTPDLCPEANGEVWSIYVHPDYWGKGVGKKLFIEFQKVMKQKGFKKICLWVLETNKNGRAFYESIGGELLKCRQDLDINGEKFPEVAYLFRK